MHQLFFPNGFEKTKVRWEKIKIKLAHNFSLHAIQKIELKNNNENSSHR
jgi:hypothetical protein